MRVIVLTFLLVFNAICYSEESPAFENGNSLKQELNDQNPAMKAMALGYITGVADVMMQGNAINGFTACIPIRVNRQQLLDITQKFINENPQTLHYTATGFIASALNSAFPCIK